MIKEVEIKVTPDRLHDEAYIKQQLYRELKLTRDKVLHFKVKKRSLDARKGRPKFLLRLLVGIDQEVKTDAEELWISFQQADKGKEVLIIGAGPAGYFAALECIEQGLRPIVLERGKDVQLRRRDLKAIQQDGIVNPESNYCFGEGGAGSYSDGKLYTRSKKRGKILKTLKLLVDHGAHTDILVDAHPHIGSNKLPKIIASIRQTITKYGGEVRFDSKVVDFMITDKTCHGVILANGCLLYTSPSPRDGLLSRMPSSA